MIPKQDKNPNVNFLNTQTLPFILLYSLFKCWNTGFSLMQHEKFNVSEKEKKLIITP